VLIGIEGLILFPGAAPQRLRVYYRGIRLADRALLTHWKIEREFTASRHDAGEGASECTYRYRRSSERRTSRELRRG